MESARELAARIEAITIAIAVKTGEGGKMFGAVTANDLLNRLKEEGVELLKKQLRLPAPVKELGSHVANVKLPGGVSTELKFEVVSENPIEEPAQEDVDAETQEVAE